MTPLILLSFLSVLATHPGAPAGATEPDSALAGRLGRTVVAAINDTTLAASAASQVFSSQVLAGDGTTRAARFLARFAASLGRVRHHHSEISVFRGGNGDRYTLHVYVRASSDSGWKDLQFPLDPSPPYGFSGSAFIADVSEPVFMPASGLESASVREWLDRYIDRQVREYDLSGAALVAFGDSIVVERYFGFEDVARRRPVTEATRFNLGSGNKMFTAIAIARLVNQGKLAYTDPLTRFFPDFPDSELARRITIHHLLTHTSGWGEIWTDDWVRESRGFTRLAQHLPYVYKVGPLGKVGERRYCNSNYILLGLVIENVTGEDYIDHIERTLTRPLGLASTASRSADSSGAGYAERMVGRQDHWSAGPGRRTGTSTGGGYSTPRDMLRFARALLGGRVVDSATLRTMVEDKPATNADAEEYGYGFIPHRGGGTTSFGHGGMAPGINFELRMFPRDDATVIVFSNQDNGAYDDLVKVLVRLVSGER
jgi:CubicO group peptidase (beta-lactamase class C family)